MNQQEFNYLINVTSKIPYPELVGVEPDYSFGRMVYNSFAGGKSELTTITTYIFEFLTNGGKEDAVEALRFIAKQEMMHLQLLGHILVSLGLEPYYMDTYGNRWCSNNVKTNFTCFEEMMDYNIQSEKDAIVEYEHLINICGNDSIKNVLARIIMDEENHIRIFEMLKKQYCKD